MFYNLKEVSSAATYLVISMINCGTFSEYHVGCQTAAILAQSPLLSDRRGWPENNYQSEQSIPEIGAGEVSISRELIGGRKCFACRSPIAEKLTGPP